MTEWKEYKLGDVLAVRYGKDHKSLGNGQYPVYGSGGIMRYADRYLYDKESILIPRKGSLNNIFYQEGPFWTVDTMFWTEIDKAKVEPKFLFYQLTLVDLENLNVGSAVPSLTVPVINDIDITLPPLDEQKRISGVLSSLDDKIDLLNRENATLEALAETLFRHYFIENPDPTWKEGKLGDYVDVIDNRGKTPPYTSEITEYPIIEVNALTGNERYVKYDVVRKYVLKEVYNSWFRGYFHKYDILISTVGSIGEMAMCLEEKELLPKMLLHCIVVISLHFIYIIFYYTIKMTLGV